MPNFYFYFYFPFQNGPLLEKSWKKKRNNDWKHLKGSKMVGQESNRSCWPIAGFFNLLLSDSFLSLFRRGGRWGVVGGHRWSNTSQHDSDMDRGGAAYAFHQTYNIPWPCSLERGNGTIIDDIAQQQHKSCAVQLPFLLK